MSKKSLAERNLEKRFDIMICLTRLIRPLWSYFSFFVVSDKTILSNLNPTLSLSLSPSLPYRPIYLSISAISYFSLRDRDREEVNKLLLSHDLFFLTEYLFFLTEYHLNFKVWKYLCSCWHFLTHRLIFFIFNQF